jgi:hypothetical protein
MIFFFHNSTDSEELKKCVQQQFSLDRFDETVPSDSENELDDVQPKKQKAPPHKYYTYYYLSTFLC